MPPNRQAQKANLEMRSRSGPSRSFSHSLFVSRSVFPPAAVCQMVAVLSVHSSDKPVGVAVREDGWSTAPPVFNLCTSCLLRTLERKSNSLSPLNVGPISAIEQLLEYAVIEMQLIKNLVPSSWSRFVCTCLCQREMCALGRSFSDDWLLLQRLVYICIYSTAFVAPAAVSRFRG